MYKQNVVIFAESYVAGGKYFSYIWYIFEIATASSIFLY